MDKDAVSAICNPSTGQYAILLELRTDKDSRSFLGFDPIDKQFKVLMMNYTCYSDLVHHILTLGTDKVMRWRKIQCPFTHYPSWGIGKYINGVLYYLAEHFHRSCGRRSFVIVRFDVRSEKFKFLVDPKCFPRGWGYGRKMINYKGKLAVIFLKDSYESGITIRNLCTIWVLDDVEKQEWSKYVYTLPEHEVGGDSYNVVGVTATSEIVLSNFYKSKPFYVFYFNPERNTLQCVEIHGNHEVVEDRRCVYAIADHVEDLKFNIMETTYAATSISPPEQTHKPTSTSTSTGEDHQHHPEKTIS